jgi:hypothetical protein
MNELEFFLLTWFFTQNSKTVDLIKKIGKNQILHIQILEVTLKMTSCRTMSNKQNWKKVKTQDSMGKTNFFLSTMPFSPWGQFKPHGCM